MVIEYNSSAVKEHNRFTWSLNLIGQWSKNIIVSLLNRIGHWIMYILILSIMKLKRFNKFLQPQFPLYQGQYVFSIICMKL